MPSTRIGPDRRGEGWGNNIDPKDIKETAEVRAYRQGYTKGAEREAFIKGWVKETDPGGTEFYARHSPLVRHPNFGSIELP